MASPHQLVDIVPALNQKLRRCVAVFDNGARVYFGENTGRAFIDGNTRERRRTYIGQHSATVETWDNLATPGALARWLLWEKPTFSDAIRYQAERVPGSVADSLLERADEFDEFPFTQTFQTDNIRPRYKRREPNDVRHTAAEPTP